jgi:putative addiction module killer protein
MNFVVEMHDAFSVWLEKMRDSNNNIFAIIIKRLRQIELGNFGDHKFISDGVFELRVHFGPGYRLYYTVSAGRVIFMLCAGKKSEQKNDIKQAIKLAKEIRDGEET